MGAGYYGVGASSMHRFGIWKTAVTGRAFGEREDDILHERKAEIITAPGDQWRTALCAA